MMYEYGHTKHFIIRFIANHISISTWGYGAPYEYTGKCVKNNLRGVMYKKYDDIFSGKSSVEKAFSENHLILFGSHNLQENSKNFDTFNSLVVTNNKLDIIFQYNKLIHPYSMHHNI